MKLFGAGAGGSGDWERVLALQDRASGLRAILVIHSLARGPAFGGIRRLVYADEDAAFADAKALAAAMSLKCALAGLSAGGAKAVILDHPGLDRGAAYAALGRAIEGLGGAYVCGPDVGTGVEDLAALRRETRFVNPAQNDAGRSTAAGVLAALRGLAAVEFGDPGLGGRRYVIQGLGAVGLRVAEALLEAGAEVQGWDIDAGARDRGRGVGVELLDEAAVFETPCEVFVPCALGQILDVERCAVAPWRAVCGAANNQLVDAQAAQVLHERKIAWLPDFLVNAGAVIEGVETVQRGEDEARARVEAGIAAITERSAKVLRAARDQDRPTRLIALEWARAGLEGDERAHG